MTKNHITIPTIQELATETSDITKFFGYPVLSCMDDVCNKFKAVYSLFNESAEKMYNCQAENEYEEAALHDLRCTMETLFYKIKEDYPGNDAFEYGALCDGIKYLISIFIYMPNIMYYKEKEKIFKYAVIYHLLTN